MHVHAYACILLGRCGHAYSEAFWSELLSTTVERAGRSWRARRARCCAPLPGGGVCGKPLHENQALRVTGCRPRGARHVPQVHTPAPLDAEAISPHELAISPHELATLGLHGAWGSRVGFAVRLLVRLRERARALGDEGGAKAVVFSRHVEALHRATPSALPHRAPSARCTADLVHHVWHRR